MEQLDLLKSRIGMKLVRIGKMTRAIATQRFTANKFEVTPEQLTVLQALIDHDGMYQRQIGAITLKDRPNITRIIKILEKMELVTKQLDVNGRKIRCQVKLKDMDEIRFGNKTVVIRQRRRKQRV